MPEMSLSSTNTIAVAAAVTTTDESYIRMGLADGRLRTYKGQGDETLVSIDELREMQRVDGLRD